MSSTVITGINELVTCDGTGPDSLGVRSNAAVVIMDDTGRLDRSCGGRASLRHLIDVGGRALIPGFVDSHSHLVFAGDRGLEFAARMTGQPYDGGGIGVTVGGHPRRQRR
jgi:imidazolonepropionase